MNLGFDLGLPFFELYEVHGDPEGFPVFHLGGFKLYGIPAGKAYPRDKIPFHPLMSLDMDKEVVFYGGSFNPWHKGHQACIDLLPREKQLVVVLDRNPQKETTQFDPFEKWKELMEKIDLKDNQAAREIYPGFLLKETVNPTITWMKYIRQKYSKSQASLMIGFDQLKNFRTWDNAEELAKLIHKLYVVSREEDDLEMKKLQEEFMNDLKLEVISLGHHPYEDVSSTKIRNS